MFPTDLDTKNRGVVGVPCRSHWPVDPGSSLDPGSGQRRERCLSLQVGSLVREKLVGAGPQHQDPLVREHDADGTPTE